MLFFLARCLACTSIFVAPLVLVVLASDDPSMMLILIIPFFGLIPAYIMALVVFVPVEALCKWIGARWLANIVVPISGGAGAAGGIVLLALVLDNLGVLARNFAQEPWALIFWVVLGFVWGVLWRIATFAVSRIGFFRRQLEPA